AGNVFLARIAHERGNPAALIRALEELQAATERPHDEEMIEEQVFTSLDLGFLPDETAAFAHYQQGLQDLRNGNERWAKTHFSKLPENTPEASRAKFTLLVTRLHDGKPTEDMEEQFLHLSQDKKLTQETRNEAMLAVARLRYEQHHYEEALQAYEKVQLPPLDPGRATLYLEEAWTRYQLREIHQAMRPLPPLAAPRSGGDVLPDMSAPGGMPPRALAPSLRARRAARDPPRRFADSLESIREREELTRDVRLKRAANAHGATKRAAKFLQS